MQGEIRNIDPTLPINDIRTGTKLIEQALWGAEIGVGLLGVFGFLALGLASIGLYGIMAYSVNQRRREIGIRMALGAHHADVLGLVGRLWLKLTVIGVVVGGALAVALARLIGTFLYGVKPADPLTYGAVAVALAGIALLACYIPARRAINVDPIVALRYE